MEIVLWALTALHCCNFLFNCFAICGLEKKCKHLCNNYTLLAMMLFDIIVLVWAQSTYFKSQHFNCNIEMADVYFWLMGEILFFYMLTAFIICYFFRKFCQDPEIKKQVEEEEAKKE